MVSVNVLIFTYMQETLIRRALDSVLSQREYGLNNIVVSDDCSSDNTWNVLVEYSKMYPSLVKPYRNVRNLGIYGNWNQLISLKGDADVYYILAGDDALCEGILLQLQTIITEKKIDCKKSVALYFDWKLIGNDGCESVYKNDAIQYCSDAFGLKLRNRISIRSCFVSKGLMSLYKPVDNSHGLSFAETMADLQYSFLAKENYYDSYLGSVYYSGIGASVGLFTEEYIKESIISWDIIIDEFHLTGKDYYWACYCKTKNIYTINPSLKNLFKVLVFYYKGEKHVSFAKKLETLRSLFVLLLKIKGKSLFKGI